MWRLAIPSWWTLLHSIANVNDRECYSVNGCLERCYCFNAILYFAFEWAKVLPEVHIEGFTCYDYFGPQTPPTIETTLIVVDPAQRKHFVVGKAFCCIKQLRTPPYTRFWRIVCHIASPIIRSFCHTSSDAANCYLHQRAIVFIYRWLWEIPSPCHGEHSDHFVHRLWQRAMSPFRCGSLRKYKI